MNRGTRRLAPITVLALILAACSGAPTPPVDETVTLAGRPYAFTGVQPAFALAIGFPSATILTAAAPLAVDEFLEGWWGGPFGYVDDGVATVAFPDADEMPAAALMPLGEAFVQFAAEPTCTPAVAPESALATASVFQIFGLAGMVALTTEGAVLTIATDAPLSEVGSLTDFEGVFYTWLFADRDATFSTPETCVEFDVELTLEAGWNQVAWDASAAPVVVARSVPLTPFHALPYLPIGATAE